MFESNVINESNKDRLQKCIDENWPLGGKLLHSYSLYCEEVWGIRLKLHDNYITAFAIPCNITNEDLSKLLIKHWERYSQERDKKI